ncbi:metal tolerance protein 2 isoform X2 [Lotus japonicus]|uniref:metal tolerance protein 2 isoform X2 n=1 Tax=Lotus japonicus TaxID=34305 RepID=UPI0025839789|nr:metal tolerance protein 2 isoform X2 [Lotus japonicus]
MGFRLNHLNPIYRTCITRSSTSSKFLPPVLESVNFFPLEPCFVSPENPAFKIPKRWHFGHSHSHDDHHHHPYNVKEEGEKIFRLGLAADVSLAVGKAFTGYVTGSTAIIADAAHSVSDVVLSGIALWSFKAAQAPRDKEHPYGHGKFETLGALGISCMLLATGGGIAWHAVDILMGFFSSGPEMVNQALAHAHGGHHHGIDMDYPILALSMTIVSIGVKEGLFWITKRGGEKQGSGLMKANAWHHRADAISSVVALIGVGGSILGVKFLDPLAGLLVSGMILKAGAESGYQSILELVDAAIPAQELVPIKQTIMQVDGVRGCHRLRGRRAGSSLYLDVHIEVDPFSSVSAAHGIGENVRHQIHKSHPTVTEIFIHIDPSMSHVSTSTKDELDSCSGDMNLNRIVPVGGHNIEGIVSDIISSNFPQMSVEHITPHMFQSKIVLQIEVSMPPDIPIRHAMELAEKAEKEVMKAVSSVVHVGIQLRLGQPFPGINHS